MELSDDLIKKYLDQEESLKSVLTKRAIVFLFFIGLFIGSIFTRNLALQNQIIHQEYEAS